MAVASDIGPRKRPDSFAADSARSLTPSNAGWVLAMLALAVALGCGGGPFGTYDAIVQSAVALLAWPWLALQWPALKARLPRAWAVLLVLITLFLLVPLAGSLWWPPALGQMPVFPLQAGDIPGQSRAALAWSVFVAMFLLVVALDMPSRVRLLQAWVVMACLMALLGLWQSADAQALRLHAYHHPQGAIGLFANRNHFADLMGMAAPIAIAFGFIGLERRHWPTAASAWTAACILLLAMLLSYSRAGSALGLGASLAMLLIGIQAHARRDGRGAGRSMLIAIALIATVGGAVAYYGLSQWLNRLEQDPLQDLRWQYLQYGWVTLRDTWPAGSGFGSFVDVYAVHEPVDRMVQVFARHAHNDFLELFIESGVIGVSLFTMFMLRVFLTQKQAVERLHGDQRMLVLGTIVSSAIPLLHSLVDYPLRTHAVLASAALIVAFCVLTRGNKPVT